MHYFSHLSPLGMYASMELLLIEWYLDYRSRFYQSVWRIYQLISWNLSSYIVALYMNYFDVFALSFFHYYFVTTYLTGCLIVTAVCNFSNLISIFLLSLQTVYWLYIIQVYTISTHSIPPSTYTIFISEIYLEVSSSQLWLFSTMIHINNQVRMNIILYYIYSMSSSNTNYLKVRK